MADRPGQEPDPRFSLANERTLLAWIRTSLALDAGGLAVIRFAPPLAVRGGREALGIVLILLGMITARSSYRRWIQVERAIRSGAPLPRSAVPLFLAVTLTVIPAVVIVLLLVDRLRGR